MPTWSKWVLVAATHVAAFLCGAVTTENGWMPVLVIVLCVALCGGTMTWCFFTYNVARAARDMAEEARDMAEAARDMAEEARDAAS